MSGQKSGLNHPLRKLIARIQKEFDFPKVYSVRCRVETVTVTHDMTIPSRARAYPGIQVMLASGPHSTFSAPEVHRVPSPENMDISCHDAACWDEGLAVREVSELATQIEVRHWMPSPPSFHIHIPKIRSRMPGVHEAKPLDPPRTRSGGHIIRKIPISFAVYPMKTLSKGLLLRYRAAVLRRVRRHAGDVQFHGYTPAIPPTRLDIVPDQEPKLTHLLAIPDGEPNPYLGRRCWIVVSYKNMPDMVPIPVREEEA